MKVALCLSGQARFGVDNYQHIRENLIVPTGADVFCHFWSNVDPSQGMDPYMTAGIYRAKKAQIEHPYDVDDAWFYKWDSKFTEVDLWKYRRMASMYRSMLLANAFAGPEYDLIIRARTDLILSKPFNMEEYSTKACYFYDNRVVEDGNLRLYGDELFWGPHRAMTDLIIDLRINLENVIRHTKEARPEVIMAKAAAKIMSKVSTIGQPSILRNESLHSKRLEALHSGRAPVNDE